MIETSFMTDEGFLRIRTIQRLRKVLQREGKVYLSELHKRCGLGLSTEQFATIVLGLESIGWCSTRQGALGATLVVFNEQFNNINVPEVSQ